MRNIFTLIVIGEQIFIIRDFVIYLLFFERSVAKFEVFGLFDALKIKIDHGNRNFRRFVGEEFFPSISFSEPLPYYFINKNIECLFYKRLNAKIDSNDGKFV